jgi:arabinan endo-1,5-alpha-L-arabinosidase
MVLQGDSRWAGVGHNAVYTFEGQDYLIFHAYDKTDNGKSKLRIEELTWTENWPSIKNK